ncbi:glycosyltransferase [Dyadobacter sp. NIV53]|uniref:glycosyltransferase n=1 Tax=Dyadobacter sp. NIV53 TaxID=2861765 RepID=UPI001C86A44A|nr:glycosyltransferase [Dyadobacter sp. NIV53]
MKILHISTFQSGGASVAAIRLHRALLANGHDSKFLFFECKESDTIFRFKKWNFISYFLWKIVTKFGIPLSLSELRARAYREKYETFSFASSPYSQLHLHPLVRESDIVNLHWVAKFVDYGTFFQYVKKPIVWTLHDMLPFQGGFHYKADEDRNAPFLRSLDNRQFEIKQSGLSHLSPDAMTIVAPSCWLTELSQHSKMLGRFEHRHIPYSIDHKVFTVLDKNQSKEKLGLSKEKLTVLFVSELLNNYRKGFDMVQQLLEDQDIKARCTFIAVGKSANKDQLSEIKYLGKVSSEHEMALIYNAADLFIIPSKEDNLPNTMIESLCCGTPVVGFSIGGLKESIHNYENGLLAENISVSQLKEALMSAARQITGFDRIKISTDAHECYSQNKQVKAYADIYNKYYDKLQFNIGEESSFITRNEEKAYGND